MILPIKYLNSGRINGKTFVNVILQFVRDIEINVRDNKEIQGLEFECAFDSDTEEIIFTFTKRYENKPRHCFRRCVSWYDIYGMNSTARERAKELIMEAVINNFRMNDIYNQEPVKKLNYIHDSEIFFGGIKEWKKFKLD